MDDTQIMSLFSSLYDDMRPEDQFHNKKPLLAHYTSMGALEQILRNNEVWFSNPLLMNDLDEVKFGIAWGAEKIQTSPDIRSALKSDARHVSFLEAFNHSIKFFEQEHLFDTYVFCASEHDADDKDGALSMWRGYGANGNGAALVFDTSKFEVRLTSPLLVAKVQYGSPGGRISWLDSTCSRFAQIVAAHDIPDSQLYVAAHALFQRVKIFALLSKHHGFKEEHEWRIVYLRDRDTGQKLRPMQHYHSGPRGIEPKLKLKIEYIEGITAPDLTLEKILHSIILGPTVSSPLAQRSILRMLELLKRSELQNRVVASSIPFRAL